MVKECIALAHHISEKGIEDDRAKDKVIERLPLPISLKGLRRFLGYAGFYRRFIKDISKIAHTLCKLLEKECKFYFHESYLKAFRMLKEKLVTTPISISPDWSKPFEVMCDASGVALCVVLGQRRDKILNPIYYASKALNQAQKNYIVTEQELHAVVVAFEKFRSYLLGKRVMMHIDDSTLTYYMAKKDTNPRLIRWVLLL